jgi:hypothetical protein
VSIIPGQEVVFCRGGDEVSFRVTVSDNVSSPAEISASARWGISGRTTPIELTRQGDGFSGSFGVPQGSGTSEDAVTIDVSAFDAAKNPGSDSVTIPCDIPVD